LFMTKLRVLVLSFPDFTDNSIVVVNHLLGWVVTCFPLKFIHVIDKVQAGSCPPAT
jgi:hypothetical protein